MRILKRSVESSQFKHKLKRFFRVKVKPVLLSIKYFFKSSHKFFMKHPRLRMCSIVGGLFFAIIIATSIMNTLSRHYLNANIDAAKYDAYVDEYWHELARDGEFSRPKETISYRDPSYGSDSCNISANISFGHNIDLTECSFGGSGTLGDPYQIDSVNKFIYVRTLGSKAKGVFFIVTENLDFNGVTLRPMDNGNNSNFFGGIIDGNFKHFKNVSLNINGSGTIVTNGLIPGIYGDASAPAIVKNFIVDSATFTLRSTMGDGVRSIGSVVGFVGPYSYAYNNGLLSGNITSTGITASSSASKGAYIGGVYGYLADFSISNAYKSNTSTNSYPAENGINGVFNSYSYANFNLSGSHSGNVKFGGVLGSRLRNNAKMDATNSLLFNLTYYGKFTVSGNADYQFVYNGTRLIEATQSPTNTYYWFKGDTRDITTNTNSWAIAQDSDYLQSDGFVANLNTYAKLMDYYFDTALGTDSALSNYLLGDYTGTEWYISRSDFGSMRPYFPILRKKADDTREHSSNNSGKTLTVNFDGIGQGSGSRTIAITDQDQVIDDYVYHKVELPYSKEIFNKKEYTSGGYTY